MSVWGDSLTVSAMDELKQSGVMVHAWPGTAPCDWLSGYEQALQQDKPTYVVLAFVGNHATDCMKPYDAEPALISKYRSDLSVMAGALAIKYGVKVAFVVPPLMSGTEAANLPRADPAIGQMYCALAATAPDRARCDTTARDLLSPDGVYTDTVGGQVVRQPDGVHLTADGAHLWAQGVVAAVK